MITKDPERQDTLESEFEGENEGADVDTSDTDNLGESLNDSRRSQAAGQDVRENSSMNGILGGLMTLTIRQGSTTTFTGNIQEMLRTAAENMLEEERMLSDQKSININYN